MALKEFELKRLGEQVVKSMLIGRKKNEVGLARSERRFKGLRRFVEENDGKQFSDKELEGKGINAKKLALLSKPDNGPLLIKRGNKWVVRATMGEMVRLVYHPDNWQLAKQIILAASRKGANVAAVPRSSAFDRELVAASPLSKLEDFPSAVKATLENIDVTIYLECEEDPEWKRGLSAVKLGAGQANGMRAHEILDDRKVRWLVLGWPFPETARSYLVKPAVFEAMMFASLKESFSPSTRKLVEYYRKALDGGDRVRITHEDGTDVSFSIKGRPMLVDLGLLTQAELDAGDVGLNIPSGEAFCAPVEGSAEGKIFFPRIHVHGHGFVDGLWLFFEKGRVARWTAKRNGVHFEKYLAENTPSTRVLAELGIGCNRAAKLTGYILTDEKIAGTIHLAIGNNTGSYHGKNKASGHLDMVKDMAHGLMVADGRVVMKGGWPVR
ncbi:hypothetical protein AUJ14_03740 [Candidatus Micrarchaeota archaeon CG1_02_55_22]|nr:MAG: hypothetical protein AUJ14_03740 [Candidatus Micrarchaeota archaeon CG1_02_55_22]